MKVKRLFEDLLEEMTKEEKDQKIKELENELESIRGEYRSADDKDKSRIAQKMAAIRTKLNSVRIIEPLQPAIRKSDDSTKRKEILKRRKIHIYRASENQDRRQA